MIKPQCEFTGNRCVKDTCENCSIYEINYLAGTIAEATEKVGNEFCEIADKITEEVYDKYYDTAGNLHWIGTKSGERMMEKEKTIITEEDHLEEVWFKQAKEQTLETLPDFINHVMNDYFHDYGTVCHAISACAIAAAYAANNSDSGGITGFQAGEIMWDFIRQWIYSSNRCGMKIVDYDDMLYPQCEFKYEKTISSYTWQSIQKEAKKNLDDYHSGADSYVAQPVLDHWQSIVDGKIPFGYTISDD